MPKPGWLIILLFLPVNGFVKAYSFQQKMLFNVKGQQLNVSALHPATPACKPKNEINTDSIKRTDWYEKVVRDIEESEYFITAKDERTYTSPNSNQQFDLSFTSDKFIIQPEARHDWELQLSFEGIYANNKKIFAATSYSTAVMQRNRIVFSQKEEFRIEYINSKEGLRQNFILLKAPSPNDNDVSIKLSVNNGWVSELVHQKEIHFSRWNKEILENKVTYNGLKVWDANEKELAASFSVDKDGISINVNTSGAEFPITIDPLSSSPVTALSGTSSQDYFGICAASAGDTNGDGYSDVVIGAYGVSSNKGKIYLYTGSATGISASPAATIDGGIAGDKFGTSVRTAGDVNGDGYSDIIVGAYGYSGNRGRAYVYLGSASGLNLTAATTLDGIAAGDNFGYSVGCAGDVNADGKSDVIVGAYGVSTETGAAYVFNGNSSGVSTTATTLSGQSAGDRFGFSVASAFDVNGDNYSDVLVGAYVRNSSQGAAYLFLGSVSGINTTPNNTLNGTSTGDSFGYSVAGAGDLNGDGYGDIIIGAYAVSSGRGAIYFYTGTSSGILTTPTIVNGPNAGGNFGVSVACAGDINGDGYSDVIVGEEAVNTSTGAIHIFQGSSTGFPASPTFTRTGLTSSCSFGFSAASAGDINGDGYSDIIVGAPNLSVNTGAAYTYHGSADGLSSTAAWATQSDQGSFYGICVAAAGDVNSDGFSDVIVGAYTYSQVFSSNGKAYLYMGSATGLSTTASWTAFGSMTNEYFGRSAASAGDVNGDGYGDVVVGGYGYTNGEFQEGRAYLFYGSAGGLSTSSSWTYENNVAGSVLGVSVAGAGDINGDGYADIVIGAGQYSNGQTSEGKVYVFYGSASGPPATPNWGYESNQTNASIGFSVAGLGDVNGDGFSDIIAGAYLYTGGFSSEGAAFAFYGSAAGLPASPNWTVTSGQANAGFGICVASAGDVNGDGYCDAIVGAYLYDNGTTDEGAAFVYYGHSTGLSTTADWTGHNNVLSSYYGWAVSSAGDVNGDGYSDVLIGAREISNGQSREGALYVYYGSSTGLPATQSWYTESNFSICLLGNSVSTAGDVNGDGFSEIIGGGPFYLSNLGGAWVYYGNNNGGLRNNLRLYNSDLVTPISQANMSDPNLFGAGLFSKSFIGSQKGKLVWQTVKNGNPFPGVPITNDVGYTAQQSSFTSLGLSGVELKNQIAKQIGNTKATYIRARVKYDPVTAITGQVYGPWRYPEGFLRGRRDIGSVALPVKFISFTAVKQGEKSLLTWVTENETTGIYYQVQRSANGLNYSTMAVLQGISLQRNTYQWPDLQPLKGQNFYRICAVETVKNSYSQTRMLNFSDHALVSLYPNPVKAGNQLYIKSNEIELNRIYQVRLTDMAGKMVLRMELVCGTAGLLGFSLPALNTGQYLLILEGKSKDETLKISVIGDQ